MSSAISCDAPVPAEPDGAQVFLSNIVELRISDVVPFAVSPRAVAENAEHTRTLAESVAAFPPIVVHRDTMQVIDGLHRLRAAQMRGEATIAAVFFDGVLAEAFVLAVKLNTTHGLPLSLADRKAAAQRILAAYPDWSDRAIAAVAGLSDKTVGAIRKWSTAEFPRPTDRVARNGVLHRAGSEGRQRAAELFTASPGISARAAAAAAGISLTTAKDVRRRLRNGLSPMPSGRPLAEAPEPAATVVGNAESAPVTEQLDTAQLLQRLRRDPSLRFTESGRKLLRWLEVSPDDPAELRAVVDNIPGHCVPSVSDLVRQRAHRWQQLADLLDQRV
ncbi:ParB/RepB/Spo0J family partition protein [Nocardia sp. NPDC050793]|uniref:ParB/RepB/Spo0J family partition protein n=1 Tax=Nocardia sp. NPDC050793 TaxID=3155159 RepID=UPI0033F22D83